MVKCSDQECESNRETEPDGQKGAAERVQCECDDCRDRNSGRIKNRQVYPEYAEQKRVPVRNQGTVGVPEIKVQPLPLAYRRGDVHLPAAIDCKVAPFFPGDAADQNQHEKQNASRDPIRILVSGWHAAYGQGEVFEGG